MGMLNSSAFRPDLADVEELIRDWGCNDVVRFIGTTYGSKGMPGSGAALRRAEPTLEYVDSVEAHLAGRCASDSDHLRYGLRVASK